MNAADLLIETLIDWRIDMLFGLPGDGINGIMEALRTRQDRIRFIQARHEEAAAFMACAYAKWTGRLGCCLATTGPGGVHLLNGLYDAKFDGAPVLAITGLPYSDLNQTFTQQDVDHTRLFQNVAAYSTAIFNARHLPHAVALACRTALAARGVAHVALPVDVQEQEVDEVKASPRNKASPTDVFIESAHTPDAQAIHRAAQILNEGGKVAILAGQGARCAGEALLRTSDILGAPIAKALLGKDVLPDDDPNVTGGVGYLGARPSQQVFDACDTLLIVGSNFPYIEYYPKPGHARAVQIDIDPARIGLRYPIETAIVGDAGAALDALNRELKRKADRSFLDQAQSWKSEWLAALDAGADRTSTPMKPQRIVRELDRQTAADAIVVADCGHNTGLAAQYIQMRGARRFGVSGTLASMGCGLPYAIAAGLVWPGRQIIAVVGDGGLSMSLGELATCVRYGLAIKILVLNNRALGQIKWEQMMFLGNPDFGCELQPVDFAKVAEGHGMLGIRLDDPSGCADAVARALTESGPALIDAVVDGNEPMLPPKRREDYVDRLNKALANGASSKDDIEKALTQEPALTSLKD